VLARMPSANFETLDGKEFSLDELYTHSPKLVIVHYWGTWCAPCEAELPELLKLIKHYENETDVHFLLVAVNDEKVKIQKHLKTFALPKSTSVHWLLDNKSVHRDIFGTSRVPETYVFSSDKSTLRKYVGPQEWNKTMFFQTFDDFLQLSRASL
jgi:thiol-disulfide isomerase/thioredoxin